MIFLLAVFAVCGPANAFTAVASDMISGAQMKRRINSFLAAQNLVGRPAISEKDYFRIVTRSTGSPYVWRYEDS